ncbi:MAG: AMP-binding protein, partial [Candidatus Methanomethylicaceae archaeon]
MLVNTLLLSDLIDKNAMRKPHKTFIVDEKGRWSFCEFRRKVNELSRGLLRAGVTHGDRVAVLQHNSMELLQVYFATMKTGAAAVPLNVLLSPKELKDIIEDADPRVLIVGNRYLEKVDVDVLKEKRIAVFAIGDSGSWIPNYEELMREGESVPEPGITAEDLAMIIYTSGTEGAPKGVMLTHKNLVSVAWATCITRDIHEDEVSLVTAPLYQAAAFGSILGNILRGTTVCLHDGFKPANVLETIEREKVTSGLFVPSMLIKLLGEFPSLSTKEVGSLRTVIYGAAPMPLTLLKEVMCRFEWEFIGAYGATETGPAYITVLDREDHKLDGDPKKEKRLASVGREGINVRVCIFDELDNRVSCGEVGEVVVRGPNVMKGYWKRPEETTKAFKGGWYHTGDLGYMDDEGYLFLVGRKKEMIISGGFNVYPREI